MKLASLFLLFCLLFSCQPKPQPVTTKELKEEYQRTDTSKDETRLQVNEKKPSVEDSIAAKLTGAWTVLEYKELLHETGSVAKMEASLPNFYTNLSFSGKGILYCEHLDWQEGDYVKISHISFPSKPVASSDIIISKLTNDTLVMEIQNRPSPYGSLSKGPFTFIKPVKSASGNFSQTLRANRTIKWEWFSGMYTFTTDSANFTFDLLSNGEVINHPKNQDAVLAQYSMFSYQGSDFINFEFQYANSPNYEETWQVMESTEKSYSLLLVENFIEEDQPITFLERTATLSRN